MTWSYAGVMAYIGLQVAINIAFARLLGPDQFGLFASGLLATGILKVISELGTGSALAQARALRTEDVRLAFTRSLLAGAAGCLLLALGSRPLALALADVRLIPVFRCFSVALLCFPVSTVCGALLARELDQKHAQFRHLIGLAHQAD